MRFLLSFCALVTACDAPMPMPAVDAGRDAPIVPIDADVTPGEWRGWDPAAPGPFFVGYRTIELTYDAPTLPGRTTTIHVWYPTLVPDGRHPRYLGSFPDPGSIIDAPLAPSAYEDGHYPVHLYSHGDQGFGPTSAFLMRRFASHGWVAIAPDHTGNTLLDNITPRPISIYFLRGTDLSASLDAMETLPTSDPLAGLLDVDRVVASGHSFGSHSMWAIAGATFDVDGFGATCTADDTCTTAELDVFRAGLGDPRVVAAIPMAGSISRTYFGAAGHTSVTIPFLSMSGGADPVGADTQFASTPEVEMTWIEVADACHQFFAIGCDGDTPLDEDLIVGGFALAFARAELLGDASTAVSSILDGSRVLSPRVTRMSR
jgi:hypothetical protein